MDGDGSTTKGTSTTYYLLNQGTRATTQGTRGGAQGTRGGAQGTGCTARGSRGGTQDTRGDTQGTSRVGGRGAEGAACWLGWRQGPGADLHTGHAAPLLPVKGQEKPNRVGSNGHPPCQPGGAGGRRGRRGRRGTGRPTGWVDRLGAQGPPGTTPPPAARCTGRRLSSEAFRRETGRILGVGPSMQEAKMSSGEAV